MNDQIIFGAQIITALGYITSLFVLYRLLVSQKDATIEVLKEKNSLLQDRLDDAKVESPLVVAESLADRVRLQEGELRRLLKEQEQNEELIQEKEQELAQARQELEEFRSKLEQASLVLSELCCPHCGAVITEMDYFPVSYHGQDAEHEVVAYACGLVIHNGKVFSPCPSKDSVEAAS